MSITSEKLIETRTTKEKLTVILILAVLAMIENILQTVVGFVDTLIVAKLGLLEVTSVGLSNSIVSSAIFSILSMLTSNFLKLLKANVFL